MNDMTLMALKSDLKELKLATMARDMEGHLRQARESGIGYDAFLLELTTDELQARAGNRLKRRIREARFCAYQAS